MIKQIITITILGLIMLGAVIYGISESGSPFETRNKKFDAQRVSDLSSISYAMESYYQKNNGLPKDLKEVTENSTYSYSNSNIKDPETKNDYQYIAGAGSDYQLCAKFSTDNTKVSDEQRDRFYDYSYTNKKWQHSKGDYCFKLNANPNLATPAPISAESPKQSTPNDTSELSKRSRDAARLTDLANLQQAIFVTVQEATSSASVLCAGGISAKGGCTGRSLDTGLSNRSGAGTGWVKVNLQAQKAVAIPVLPVDPTNDGIYHYTYCSDGGSKWEINTILESSQQSPKMASDGGNDNSVYEIGSDLTMIGVGGRCTY